MHDRALEKFYRKLEWASALGKGDSVSVMKHTEHQVLMNLWPVEYVKRSAVSKQCVQIYNQHPYDAMDLRHMTHMVRELNAGDAGIFTGNREFGWIPAAVSRQVWLGWYTATPSKQDEIEYRFRDILGDDSFIATTSYSFNIRVPFLEIVPMGFSGIGYVAPHIITPMKKKKR